ncbi:MAG: OmpP1/FadL family transporter [Cetobacterium sp.]
MKFRQKLMILGTVISVSSFAGSIDYLSQQDAEYLAHPAMVGKIGVSGAYYNPAGLVWLEDGTYIQVNNQTHLKDYSMEIDGQKFKSDKPSAAVPSLQIVKKAGDTAYFFHAGAIAGGGSVAYKGGIGTFESMANELDGGLLGEVKYLGGSTIHGQSYYVAFQGGIAKKFNDSWSGAVGLRVVDAERKLKGNGEFSSSLLQVLGQEKVKFDIDSERSAFGVSGIFGLNYHPNDNLNLSMRYETETKLDFDTKEHRLSKFMENLVGGNPVIGEWTNAGDGKRNLPAVAALGASYKVTEKTTILASGNYYFIKEAGDDFNAYDYYDNGYEVSIGLDYELNDKWILMTGYQYTDTGANEKTYKDTDYALDADMYSIGAKYKYNTQLDLMFTYSYVDYKTGKNKETQIEYKKHVDAFGLGAIYKF